VKTVQKYVFLDCEIHIQSLLGVKMLYIILLGCWNKPNFTSKSRGVSFQFYGKLPFVMKTDRRSVFLSYDDNISAWLDILLLYIIFWICKNMEFLTQNSKGLRFYRKQLFTVKNDWKIIFLRHVTNILSRLYAMVLYIKELVFSFIEMCLFAGEIDQKYLFLSRETDILAHLDVIL
jgi:hypothetical protein